MNSFYNLEASKYYNHRSQTNECHHEEETFSTGKDRRSYMSAHVLLNLLNELGKRDFMYFSQ